MIINAELNWSRGKSVTLIHQTFHLVNDVIVTSTNSDERDNIITSEVVIQNINIESIHG